ncbi:MAG: YheU family protein [Pseudomonadota bacterium]
MLNCNAVAVIIPYDQLSSQALSGVIEEFVTRDGTDYGLVEVPLETKMAQMMRQLKNKKIVIVFDPTSQTCNLLSNDDPAVKKLIGNTPLK